MLTERPILGSVKNEFFKKQTIDAKSQTQFDYVIIGAGSSGCVLADRLSASGRYEEQL